MYTYWSILPVHVTAVRLHRNNASVMKSLMLNEWKPVAGRWERLSEWNTHCLDVLLHPSSSWPAASAASALCSSVLGDGSDVLKEAWKSSLFTILVLWCRRFKSCHVLSLSLPLLRSSVSHFLYHRHWVRVTSSASNNEYAWICVFFFSCSVGTYCELTLWNVKKLSDARAWDYRTARSVQVGSVGQSVFIIRIQFAFTFYLTYFCFPSIGKQ